MKFLLLSVVCLAGIVCAKPALRKRDILPGDPRYGTDYHHHHHQHQASQAEPVPHSSYGPPSYTPGQPIHYQETVQHTVQEVVQPVQQYVQSAPSHSVANFQPSETVETISNGYLSPVVQAAQAPVVHQEPQLVYQPSHHQVVAQNNGYLAPAAQAPSVTYATAAPVQYQQVSQPQQQPANGYLGPVIQAASQPTVQHTVDSYGTPVGQQQAVHHEVKQAPSHYHATTVHHEVKQAPVQRAQPLPIQVFKAATFDRPVEIALTRNYVQAQAQTHQYDHHQAVQASQQAQEHVTHVHHVAQPIVRHHVIEIQPAVREHIIQHSVPQAQESSYSSAGFQSLGSVSNVGSYDHQASAPVYSSELSNAGLSYHQELPQLKALPANFATGLQAVQEPQLVHVQATKQVNYPAQVPEHETSPAAVSQVSDLVKHVDLRGFGNGAIDTESVRVESADTRHAQSGSHQEQTQLVDSNGGYVY